MDQNKNKICRKKILRDLETQFTHSEFVIAARTISQNPCFRYTITCGVLESAPPNSRPTLRKFDPSHPLRPYISLFAGLAHLQNKRPKTANAQLVSKQQFGYRQ